MPKKLVDCVKEVEAEGKPAKSAWPICITSTGLKPEQHKKGKKQIGPGTHNNSKSSMLDTD